MQADLFDDFQILYNDVALYLRGSHFLSVDSSQTRIESYIKNYDIANKILELKRLGLFDSVISENLGQDNITRAVESVFAPRMVEPPKKPTCPAYFHVCDNHECSIFQRRISAEKRRARYQKTKKAKG